MVKAKKAPRGAVRREENKADKKQFDEEKKLADYIPEKLFADEEENAIAVMIFLISAGIYIYTMYPGLPGGDSGELMSTAKDFGVSHPPGYPLFTTMACFMINLFPFGTTAWKVNLMSSLTAGLTNAVMYLTIKKVSNSDAAGLLACGWCGFSRVFWMWNIQGEVFSLSNFFACAILYCVTRFANAEGRPGKFYEAKIGALVCGLALTNQHTSVLFIFPVSLWVLFTLYRNDLTDFKSLWKVGLHGLAGLSPYLQLPISSFFFKARVSWGDHRLFSDFKKHLLREDFGTFRLISSTEVSTFYDNFMVYFTDSSGELTIVVWALFALTISLGPLLLSGKKREIVLMITAMFAVYHLVFCNLANIKNPSGIYHGVLERFWLQPSTALCTLAGIGVGCVLTEIRTKLNAHWLKYLFIAAAVCAVGFQVQRNYEDCNENDNMFFHHYSRHILPHLPRRSILMTSGDFSTNTFRYHTIGEEYRTDVMVMDMQFMQAYWFYICLMPINWPDISFPGLYKPGKASVYPFYNLKTFLDENLNRFPVYMCVSVPEAEDSIEGYYEAVPFGMCKKFVRVSDNIDPIEHLATAPWIDLDKYPLPDLNRYETQTWEYTMAMSMLETYIKPATWLWEKSNAAPEPLRTHYMTAAYEIIRDNRKYIHDRIESGKLAENMVYFVSPMEKQLGHICLIVYSYSKTPQEKLFFETCTRTHWANYVQWQRDDIVHRDTMHKQIVQILGTKDFSTLVLR